VAAAAVLVSDATGPTSEIRRQFFFSLSGAVLCALLAALFADWFRRFGHGSRSSILWAAGGIFCTPIWYYGTTAYDDVLGTLVVLTAIYAAYSLKQGGSMRSAVVSGLLMGLAFNCKPPLVLFLPAAIAAFWRPELPAKERWLHARVAFFCAALGVIVYELYDLWKFPPSTWAAVAEARGEYVAMWPGNPLAGLLSLLFSPGMGAIWYWPAVLLALYGLVACCTRRSARVSVPVASIEEGTSDQVALWGADSQRRFALMVGLSSLAFLGFISTIRFFSGEPAWGPRYLTPVFGLLWLFVPAAAARVSWPKTAALLIASFAIQVLGLTLEPMRFFTGDNVVAAEAFLKNPWTYFRFDRSQLLARPQQIWDVLTYDGPPPQTFTPAKAPTLPLIIYVKTKEQFVARDYQVLSSMRPWWLTYRHLLPDQRPIDLDAALELLLSVGSIGLAVLMFSFVPLRRARCLTTSECPAPGGWPSQAVR
jgi:4-amino-4-deoxy-L-arabinose transferase-like glycosyltransferase